MTDFNKIFSTILHTPENEVVEFKEAKESFDIDDLGKYWLNNSYLLLRLKV